MTFLVGDDWITKMFQLIEVDKSKSKSLIPHQILVLEPSSLSASLLSFLARDS